MKKIICYVDGYNLFHSTKNNPSANINLRVLAESFINEDNSKVVKVHYFSAFSKWRKAYKNHVSYVENLKANGVIVTLSRFSRKKVCCQKCNHCYLKAEEKETDVYLALQMFEDAMDNKFDVAYIMSADSDMIPAIKKIRERFPEKQIIATVPKHQAKNAYGVISACNNVLRLSKGRIKRSLFTK